jgi:hypothetical protein
LVIASRFLRISAGRERITHNFRIARVFASSLKDLRDDAIRERLRLIWLDPNKLDPTKNAAKATRAVAERLAKARNISRGPDRKPLCDPESVASDPHPDLQRAGKAAPGRGA